MADRYYLPATQVLELSAILEDAEEKAPDLVAEVRRLVFATPIPDDAADEVERQLDNAETGLSI
ncbi:hypothetical protein GCM10011415_27910 [Salipiger pallidus]|uniref:Uncharacterized protein n=1 Tax=Salipiger pallidus TaxID=1775170 RepID=A0A8J3EHB0_9RHOB|nr:hypothetical protein [Salipiger pallidus]GGG77433.1 hypothetical protein GCM10011415_27910 [Salipiger pallidus]